MSRGAITAAAVVALALAASCGSKERARGQIIVAIQADMPLPKEVDDVRVEVLVRGDLRFGNDYTVGANYLKLPATIAIVSEDPTAPVTIRVIGKKGNTVRTLREAVMTVPKDRAVTLRMPIQWLCDGSGVAGAAACADDQTCHAGACVKTSVPETDLPEYTAPAVFGGGDESGKTGACFDTVPCMLAGTAAVTDAACTVRAPSGSANVNVALRVPAGGICDESETNCFVPLDGHSRDGWEVQDGVIRLPPAVCDRLQDGRVRAVVVSTACATKTESVPTCGPWSSVPSATGVLGDAGAAGPTLLATVPAALGGGDRAVCCPLMASGAELHTCVCRPGSPTMDVVGVSSVSGQVRVVGSPPVLAIGAAVPAAIHGGVLYFIDRDTSAGVKAVVKKVLLSSGQTTELGPRIAADVLDESSLLADEQSLYALAGNVQDAGAGAELSLLEIDRASGASTAFGTGSNKAVLQLAQDAQAVYVASILDAGSGPGAWQRTSRIVRIDKASGARTTRAEAVVQTKSENRGGFFGLRIAGGSLFATQEGDARPDGTYDSSFVRVSLADGVKTTLLQQLLRVDRTENKSLGVAGSSLLVFQNELEDKPQGTPGSIRASSLSVLPTGGGPARVVADFLADAPLGLGQGLVDDGTFVYWMNRSGRIFKLPHPAP